MKICALFLIVCSLLVVSTVHAQPVLMAEANFDSDTPGEAPDMLLPGGPTGDDLYFNGQSIGEIVVESSLAGLDDQPLRMQREAGPGGFIFGLDLPGSGIICDQFTLKWSMASVTGSDETFIVLRGYRGALFGSLKVTSDYVGIHSGWGSQTEVFATNLVNPGANHFEWFVDRQAKLQTLIVNGQPVIEDLVTDFFSPLETPVTRLAFEPFGQTALTFALDDMEIWVDGCTPTPVDEKSWGSVKSAY